MIVGLVALAFVLTAGMLFMLLRWLQGPLKLAPPGSATIVYVLWRRLLAP